MRAARRAIALAGLAFALCAVGAPPALAVFHEILVREVYPGSVANPESEYVELQMYSAEQDLVKGHGITVHDAAGAEVASAKFASNVGSGANQATIVAATPAAEAEFGFAADVSLSAAAMTSAGGAVCWDGTPDCVSWGSFSGPLESPAGSPAAPGGIPDGQALRRSIARGCASLLERSDDKDNSAGDFDLVFPGPRPNSVPPTERACGGGGSGGGAGGGGGGPGRGGDAPRTMLKRKPAKRTRDRTPTFRFASDRGGARFQCKLDRGKFRACRSPFTARRLSFGRHTFRVRAIDAGEVDSTPARYTFRVLRRPH